MSQFWFLLRTSFDRWEMTGVFAATVKSAFTTVACAYVCIHDTSSVPGSRYDEAMKFNLPRIPQSRRHRPYHRHHRHHRHRHHHHRHRDSPPSSLPSSLTSSPEGRAISNPASSSTYSVVLILHPRLSIFLLIPSLARFFHS